MTLLENEITTQNIERARNNTELEQYNETEHKLTPLNPSVLIDQYRATALPVEQIYLSNPNDEFSLRVRRTQTTEGQDTYTATLKTRGEIVNSALRRNEIDTEISAKTFAFYAQQDLPRITKYRADICDGVTVDFYNNPAEPVVVEVEHEDSQVRAELLSFAQEVAGGLIDRSNNPALTNEAIAHRLSGKEHLQPAETLDAFTHRVLGEMLAHYSLGKKQVVVGLTGMSGSGKTTVARALQTQITELFGEQYTPTVLSTDDYHFGKTYLEKTYGAPYQDWDSEKTYNTAELARDLARHAEGTPLIKRHFDFDTEEPAYDTELPLSPFIIIEGLYAGSRDLYEVRDAHFELPTNPATSIGRDIRRLLIDNRANRAFPDAPSRLRYQIESALPLYQGLERPRAKAFSACSRPMAERAFMLARYTTTS
ncbi:MAG: hypothetical protein ACREGE_03780 [Candidatus Microsaccharimonas sp.]